MTVHFYIARPQIMTAVQWDGTNTAEVQATFPGIVFTDNGDGTLTYSQFNGPFFPPTVVTVSTGQWISSPNQGQAPNTTDDNPFTSSSQEVDSAGPFDYTVTAVTP